MLIISVSLALSTLSSSIHVEAIEVRAPWEHREVSVGGRGSEGLSRSTSQGR